MQRCTGLIHNALHTAIQLGRLIVSEYVHLQDLPERCGNRPSEMHALPPIHSFLKIEEERQSVIIAEGEDLRSIRATELACRINPEK
jgi:hypothetical protein